MRLRRMKVNRNELGKCEVGDVIIGDIYKCKLKVLSKSFDDKLDREYYDCVYLDGVYKGEHLDVYPFYEYTKVTE